MELSKHWTNRSADDFTSRILFDFATQIEQSLEAMGSSQAKLAEALHVSPGRVSQVLNRPSGMSVKTIVRYARGIKRKVAIVLYDDGDPGNRRGPVNADIFAACWERCSRPTDFFELREPFSATIQRKPQSNAGVFVMPRAAGANNGNAPGSSEMAFVAGASGCVAANVPR